MHDIVTADGKGFDQDSGRAGNANVPTGRTTANVIRAGHEQPVDPSALVVGDLLVVRPGDQIVVDGRLVGKGWIDVDESLLTGESDLIRKCAGDPVSSGSFCVNGSAVYEAL